MGAAVKKWFANNIVEATQVTGMPVITAQNEAVLINGTILASALVGSVYDPNGYAITAYDFRDDGTGGGYFSLSGITQASGGWITVSASNLASLSYVGGAAPGSETVDVAAWDGVNWSYYQTATVTTQGPALPVVVAQAQTVQSNGLILAATLIGSVSDPNGYAITSYDFRDDGGGGGGHFSLSGVTQAAGGWISVSAANLSQLQFVGGTAPGSETVDVAAWDGVNWSYYQTTTVTTVVAQVVLPVITAQNQAVIAGGSIQAGSLIASVSDPGGKAITAYDFRDDGGGGGALVLNGATQISGGWITVSAANLAQLQFVGGASAGSETIDVAASDGTNWSYYQTAVVTTQPILPAVLTVSDQAVGAYQTIPAAALINSVNDPNNFNITYYDFRDDGGTGGHFSLKGATQATGAWITVATSDLGNLQFAGGAFAGSETVDVAAWDGYSWSVIETATVITKPAQNINPPGVIAQNETIGENQSVLAASLIASVSDPSKLGISYYSFLDQGGTGGYFILNGLRQATGSWITVSASDLGQLLFTGTATPGTEAVEVSVWNSQSWSNAATATITTQAPQVARPLIAAQNQTLAVNGTIQAAALVASVSDPAGYAISAYDFRDAGADGGHLSLNGVIQAANTWITVSTADLAQLQYMGGATAGSESIDVAVSDGVNWSNYQTAVVTTQAVALPVIAAQDQTVKSAGTLQASALIASASVPAGFTITEYDFRDDGGGGGYLALNGVQQTAGHWIAVSAADLPKLQFVAGASAGSETIDVAVSDAANQSSFATSVVTTQGTLAVNSVLAALTDAGIEADAAKYIVNGTLTYSGMLSILDDAAAGSVTASEFKDLQTIVSYFNKTNGIQVSPYLAYISTRLINGDAANAFWTGGAMSAVALGNLAPGSTQTQMNELIGKWFLGTDLPAPVFDSAAGTIAYVTDNNPLFGAGGVPSINDINQGYLGDCYLLASLAEVAQDQPAAIQSMFASNGNQT